MMQQHELSVWLVNCGLSRKSSLFEVRDAVASTDEGYGIGVAVRTVVGAQRHGCRLLGLKSVKVVAGRSDLQRWRQRS